MVDITKPKHPLQQDKPQDKVRGSKVMSSNPITFHNFLPLIFFAWIVFCLACKSLGIKVAAYSFDLLTHSQQQL